MTPADQIAQSLPDLCQDRGPTGSPIKGKLKCLVINTVAGEGWQAIAQFWFVEKWNCATNSDPLEAIADVLTKAPDMTPFSKGTPDFVAAVDPEPAVAEDDDLLV